MVLIVLEFKYVCSGFLCCVCGLISLNSWLFLWFLGMFAELQKVNISFILSVHLQGTTQLPLDGFS